MLVLSTKHLKMLYSFKLQQKNIKGEGETGNINQSPETKCPQHSYRLLVIYLPCFVTEETVKRNLITLNQVTKHRISSDQILISEIKSESILSHKVFQVNRKSDLLKS